MCLMVLSCLARWEEDELKPQKMWSLLFRGCGGEMGSDSSTEHETLLQRRRMWWEDQEKTWVKSSEEQVVCDSLPPSPPPGAEEVQQTPREAVKGKAQEMKSWRRIPSWSISCWAGHDYLDPLPQQFIPALWGLGAVPTRAQTFPKTFCVFIGSQGGLDWKGI